MQSLLRVALGHFVFKTPLADVICSLGTVIEFQPMFIARLSQTRPLAGIGPPQVKPDLPVHHLLCVKGHRNGPQPLKHQQVIVRVPAVVMRALTPVCDLQRLDFCNGSHLQKQSLDGSIVEETVDRFRLLCQQLGKVVLLPVRTGKSEQVYATTEGFVSLHCMKNFSAPPLRDLCRAHRTTPHGAAGLQAFEMGRLVFDRLPDLNVLRG